MGTKKEIKGNCTCKCLIKCDVALQYRFIGVYSMWRLYIIFYINLMDYGFRACRMNIVWVVVVLICINVG